MPSQIIRGITQTFIVLAILTILASSSFAAEESCFTPLDFEDGVIPGYIKTDGAEMKIITGKDDGRMFQVDYQKEDFPTVKFTAPGIWNFGMNNALIFKVTNPGDKITTVYLRIDDDSSADGENHSMVCSFVIHPGATETVYYPFTKNTVFYGMVNLPKSPVGRLLSRTWGEESLNAEHIVEFQLWQMYPVTANTLIFDNFAVVPDPGSDMSYLKAIVDEYGQYTKLEWEGKVHSDQDLITAREREAKEFADDTTYRRSRFGGWADGPRFEATGHFRTAKHKGIWTLIDPEGYLFFATGIDIIRIADCPTWVTGREAMFTSLPKPDVALAKHFLQAGWVKRAPFGVSTGMLFNHYTANLERKYGDNYMQKWRDISLKRFKNWGFSGMGNWIDPELFFGKGEEMELAYVANGWITGNHAMIPSGNPFWAPVADPFDPEFSRNTKRLISKLAEYGIQDDPWCMGIYIDNEIAWGNAAHTNTRFILISEAFKMDADMEQSHAKRRFLEVLNAEYKGDITVLNQSWETSFTSFDDMKKPFESTLSQGQTEDYSTLLTLLAKEYYRTVSEAITAKMPHTMYLGSRFAEWGTGIEVQRAAAEHADIISYNVYKENVHNQKWMHLSDLNMPAIIGEFHMGATDRGMFGGGLVSVRTQQERGKGFSDYMYSVLENPYLVGAHWFQYMDQPLIGRALDGENYNIGFVDITDTPYMAMVTSAKKFHRKMYTYRFNPETRSNNTGSQRVISFENTGDSELVVPYKEARVQTISTGATCGKQALSVNVGNLDTNYSGIEIRPDQVWNLGSIPGITADITNPAAQAIQLRINITDTSNATRTFYFNIPGSETVPIKISNFGPETDNWGNESGWWGAGTGLDRSNITALNLYLWEEKDGGSGDTFIIDNLRISME